MLLFSEVAREHSVDIRCTEKVDVKMSLALACTS